MARMDDWGGTQLFALEITRPVSGLHANDRWKHAYPGLPYAVRVGAVGGVYPYRYELINPPAGMDIDEDTGEISWPNPQSNASNIQVKVTDTKGTEVTSATWSITVATTRFRFVDNVNGNDTWNGTAAAFVSGTTGPWKTLGKFQADGTIQTIGYFRTGTYNVYDTTNCAVDESDATRWGTAQDRPCMFLPYPGETPIFDHGYVAGVTEGLMWDFGNSGGTTHVWVEGGEQVHGHNKTLRIVPTNNFYAVVRDAYFHDFGPGQDGSNSAAIDFESGNYTSGDNLNVMVDGCEFSHYTNNAINCCLKMYSTDRLLIEYCDFHDLNANGADEEAIANKAGNRLSTVRNCTSSNMDQGTYGGNQNGNNANGYQCNAELAFNYFQCTGDYVVNMNHDNESELTTRMHRNTFRGTFNYVQLDADAGPYIYDRNVIVNGDAASDNPNGSGITFGIAPGANISRITVQNHLFGPNDGSVIDSNGLLVNRSLVGQYGFEIDESGEEEPTVLMRGGGCC